MNNIKNMVIAAVAMISFSTVHPSIEPSLSYDARVFVENSKKQGLASYFARAAMREDWLVKALICVTGNGRVQLRDVNKNYYAQQLKNMVEILVLAPLRTNQKITDDQYQSIASKIEQQIENCINQRCQGCSA